METPTKLFGKAEHLLLTTILKKIGFSSMTNQNLNPNRQGRRQGRL